MAKSDNHPNRRQSRLGRGLSSLMSGPVQVVPGIDVTEAEATSGGQKIPEYATADGDSMQQVPVHNVKPNPRQARKTFEPTALQSLADSIKSAGVMQPVTVRRASDGKTYELVAGERRWRAAKIAGFDRIPVIVRDLSDGEVAEWSLIENLQREDLNPIERAAAFQSLIDRFGLSHEQIGERVGVERSTISNALRLLTMDDQVQDMLRQGLLSASQAKVLAGMADLLQQRHVAKQAVTNDWPVRRIEQAVRQTGGGAPSASSAPVKPRASHLADLERQISEQLSTKASLRSGRKKGTGTLSIEFYSLDQFESLLERLGVQTE